MRVQLAYDHHQRVLGSRNADIQQPRPEPRYPRVPAMPKIRPAHRSGCQCRECDGFTRASREKTAQLYHFMVTRRQA